MQCHNFKLQERREKFQEELAEYAIQLEEFQTLGDVSEIHEYLRRARSLHTRLDHAANYVDQINKEEEALSWNTTHYPLRKQVCSDATKAVMNWVLKQIKQVITDVPT